MYLISVDNPPVAEGGNSGEGLPSSAGLVDLSTRLVLGGIGLNDLVIVPHVSDGHTVLGESTGLVGADG